MAFMFGSVGAQDYVRSECGVFPACSARRASFLLGVGGCGLDKHDESCGPRVTEGQKGAMQMSMSRLRQGFVPCNVM